MSDQHKVWIESALHDLSSAIHLHRGGFWSHATINAQQSGEKFGKSILLFAGVTFGDAKTFSHRIPKINEKIESLGLHHFSDIEQNMAKKMQRIYMEQKYPLESSEDPPHALFDKIDSESCINWAFGYLDMAMHIIPNGVTNAERNTLQLAFTSAKDFLNA